MTEQSTMSINIHGDKIWKRPDGTYHCEDGPTIVRSNGTKEWFINGRRHREDGPAIEWNDGGKQWWMHLSRRTK